jgi:hypothetical protein
MTLALVAGMPFIPPAFGQEPVASPGPQKPAQQAELEDLKARINQLERTVEDLKKKESEPPAPLSPGTSTEVPAIDRGRTA